MGNTNAKNALSNSSKRLNEPEKGDDLDRPLELPPAEDAALVAGGEKPAICPSVPSFKKVDSVSGVTSPNDISAPETANSFDDQLNMSPPIPTNIIPVTFEGSSELNESESLPEAALPIVFRAIGGVEANNLIAKPPTLKTAIKMPQRGMSFDLGKSSIQSPRVSKSQSSQMTSSRAPTPGLGPSSRSRGLEIAVANRNSLASNMSEEERLRIKAFLVRLRPLLRGTVSVGPKPEGAPPQNATVHGTTDLALVSSPTLAVKEPTCLMKDVEVAEPSFFNGINASTSSLVCSSMPSAFQVQVTETCGPRVTLPLRNIANVIEEPPAIERTASKSKAEDIAPDVELVLTPLLPYSTQNSIVLRELSTNTVSGCDTISRLTASSDVTVNASAPKVSTADTLVSIPVLASPSVAEITIDTQVFLPFSSIPDSGLIHNESTYLSNDRAPVNYDQGSGNNGTDCGDAITPFEIHSEGIPHTVIPIDCSSDNSHLPSVTTVDRVVAPRITSTPPAPEYANSDTSITVNVYPDPEDFDPPREALSMMPINGCNSTFCLDMLDRRGDLEQPNLLDLSFPGNTSNLTMNLSNSNSAIAMKDFFNPMSPQGIQTRNMHTMPRKIQEDCSIHAIPPISRGELEDSIVLEPTIVPTALIMEMQSRYTHHVKQKQAQTVHHEKSPLAAEISDQHNRKEIDLQNDLIVDFDASSRFTNVNVITNPPNQSHPAPEIEHFGASPETDLLTITPSQMPEHTADRPNWAVAPDDTPGSLRIKAEGDPSFGKQSNDCRGRRQRNSIRKSEDGSFLANNTHRQQNGSRTSQERDMRSRKTRADSEPQLRDRQLAAVNLLLTQRKNSPTTSRSDVAATRVYPPVTLPDQGLLNVHSQIVPISDIRLSPVQEWWLPLDSGTFLKQGEVKSAQQPGNLQIDKVLVNGAVYEQTNQVLNQVDGARNDCAVYASNTGQRSVDRSFETRLERHCTAQIEGFNLHSETCGAHKRISPLRGSDKLVMAQRSAAVKSEALSHGRNSAFHVWPGETCPSKLSSPVLFMQYNSSLVPIVGPSSSEEDSFHEKAKGSMMSYGKMEAIQSQTSGSVGDMIILPKQQEFNIPPEKRHGASPITLSTDQCPISPRTSIAPAPNNCVDLKSLLTNDVKSRIALLSDTPMSVTPRASWLSPSRMPVSPVNLKNKTPRSEHRSSITFNQQRTFSQPQPSAVDWPPPNSHTPGTDDYSPILARSVLHGTEPHTVYTTPQPLSLHPHQPAPFPSGSTVTANIVPYSASNLRASVTQTLGTEILHPQRSTLTAGIPNTPFFAFNFHQQTLEAISVTSPSVAHVDESRSAGSPFEGDSRVDNYGSGFSKPTPSTDLKQYTAPASSDGQKRPRQFSQNSFKFVNS